MKKSILFILSLLVGTIGYADSIKLNNLSSHPTENLKSKIAIQWATSARDVEKNNNSIKHGLKLNPDTLQVLSKAGVINVDFPKNAGYFRIVVWSKGAGDPDFLTNWVDIVSNKTYTLNKDHLIPLALMSGTGC